MIRASHTEFGEREASIWAAPEPGALIRERRRRSVRRVHAPFEFEQLEPRILLSATVTAASAPAVSQPEQQVQQPAQPAATPADQASSSSSSQTTNGAAAPAQANDFKHVASAADGSLFVAPLPAAPADPQAQSGGPAGPLPLSVGPTGTAKPPALSAPVNVLVDDGAISDSSESNLAAPDGNGLLNAGGTISGSQDWSGTVYLTDNVTIDPGGVLNIAAGTVVKFGQGRYLLARGTLNVTGVSANPVIFTSYQDDSVGDDASGPGTATPASGDWQGLFLDGGTVAMNNAEVRYAGASGVAAISARGAAATLQNVVIKEAAGTGFYRNAGAPSLDNVSVAGAGGVAFYSEWVPRGTYSNLSATGTGGNHFQIPGGDVFNATGDAALSVGGLPIYLTSRIQVYDGKTLTIAAGQVVKMAGGAYIDTSVNSTGGRILAQGTSVAPVIFTSLADDTAGGDSNADGNATLPARGSWNGIYLRNNDGGSVLDYVELRYGGSDGNNGALNLAGANATVSHVTVTESASRGVRLTGGAPSLNTVTVDGAGGAAFDSNWAVKGSFVNLTALHTAGDHYRLAGGDLNNSTGDWTWSFGGLPVHVTGFVQVYDGRTLTISPGLVIKMVSGISTAVNSTGGRILAQGTVGAPIIFTSTADDTVGGDSNSDGSASSPARGNWNGIYFLNNDAGSTFEHVELRFAGSDSNWGALNFGGGSPSARNVTIKEAAGRGVRLTGGAPVLDFVTVDGAAGVAFDSAWAVKGSYTNLVALHTSGDQFRLAGGDLYNGTGGDWTWYFGGLPVHVTGNVRVYDGKTLTITPGLVIKMAGGYIDTSVNNTGGRILAQGTVGAPIIFTSTADDTVGGDSNSDGSVSSPARGNWNGIYFHNNDSGSLLDHVEMRYAGSDPNWGSLNFNGGTPTASNVTVKETAGRGVRINNGAPVLDTVTVDGATGVAFDSAWAVKGSYTNLVALHTSGDQFRLAGGDLYNGTGRKLDVVFRRTAGARDGQRAGV